MPRLTIASITAIISEGLALGAADFDVRLQADAANRDTMVGAQRGAPNFSSDAKLKPGHFIDPDSGMDCENIGGASVCGPPSGTVRCYDPEEGLNCSRSGLVSVCSNMAEDFPADKLGQP
jgi:hypothetical protein